MRVEPFAWAQSVGTMALHPRRDGRGLKTRIVNRDRSHRVESMAWTQWRHPLQSRLPPFPGLQRRLLRTGSGRNTGPSPENWLTYNKAVCRRGLRRRFGSTCPVPVKLSIPVTFIACLGFSLPVATAEDTFDSLLRQGFELHQQRRFAQAIAPLERARRLQPNDYFANLLLGIDYLRTGQAVKALSFLETARRTRPADATALGYSAEAHAASGRVDLAIGALRAAKLRDSSPQWPAALIRLYLARFRTISQGLRSTRAGLARSYRLQAHAMRERNDPKESEVLLRAYALSPDLEGIESELAHAEIRRKRFDLARRFLERARARSPKDLEIVAAEVYLAAHSGDWDEAEARLRELGERSRRRAKAALMEWPDDVQLPDRLRNAVEQAEASKLAGAETASANLQMFASQDWEAVTTGVSPDETSRDELFLLGVAHAQLNRFEKAVAPLERARTVPRYQGEADYWLALSYARLAEEEAALLGRDQSAGSVLHSVRGEILLRLAGDGVAAVAEYKKAVALTPGDPALWAGLAAAEALAGDWDGARDSAIKALEFDPNRTLALQTFSEVCMQERDYAAAIPALRRVLELEPADVDAQFLLGTAYSQTGEHHEALGFLRAAERQGFPDEKGRLQYLLGTVLRRLGRHEEAREAFHRSQELADTFAGSSHELAQPVPDAVRN